MAFVRSLGRLLNTNQPASFNFPSKAESVERSQESFVLSFNDA